MPSGRLTRIVSKATSDAFPEGCAYTGLQLLKKKIGKVSAANEAILKETFESNQKWGKGINPSKYIDKLKDIKDELFDKYSYTKTDRDIIDQVMKVLNKDYEWTKRSIKEQLRKGEVIDITDLQEELEETYLEIKEEKKKSKKTIEVSDDSSNEDKEHYLQHN